MIADHIRELTLARRFLEIKTLFEKRVAKGHLVADYQCLFSILILERNLEGALSLLKTARNLAPDHYDLAMQQYVFGGNCPKLLKQLRLQDPAKTATFLEAFQTLEAISTQPIPQELPQNCQDHCFVLLGYALNPDSSIAKTLEKRLELGLKALQLNPDSSVILTGGVGRQGITESVAMAQWLMARGIDRERLNLESASKDTLENAYHSLPLTAASHLTLLTSGDHARRAKLLFTVADNGKRTIDAVATDLSAPTQQEKIHMYFDLLRHLGIWQYPGIYQ